MKGKVLVIEDTPDMALLIKGSLRNLYDIVFCVNGQEAIKTIDNEKFDIILLDLMLPDISGFELASIMKDNPNSKDAFIVVISAKEDIASKVTAYSLGAINYLEKPFEPRLLRSIVASLMSIKSTDKEAILEFQNITINLLAQKIFVDEIEIKTTSSEFKIFCYLLQREGQIISRDKLLDLLGNLDADINDRIVDTHISALRKKLKNAKLQIKAAYGEGYLLSLE